MKNIKSTFCGSGSQKRKVFHRRTAFQIRFASLPCLFRLPIFIAQGGFPPNMASMLQIFTLAQMQFQNMRNTVYKKREIWFTQSKNYNTCYIINHLHRGKYRSKALIATYHPDLFCTDPPKGHSEWKNRSKYSPARKLFFLSSIINTGLVQVHFGPFWPPGTIGGVWGGTGGWLGGLQTPKMT